MALPKQILRSLVRQVTASGVPGRYKLVEVLRPALVQRKPVVTTGYGGLRFALDLNDLVQRQIYFELYDKSEIELLRTLIKPGDVVFDMGGNVGLYAVIFARQVGPTGQVHVFEPMPRNVKAIRRNLALNGLEQTVVVNPVAVTDDAGELELFFAAEEANSGWASVVPSASRQNRIVVQAVRPDNYVRQNGIGRVTLVKMDIEGAELHALNGMTALLERPDAPMIYLEINPYLLEKSGTSPAQVKGLLAGHGYTLLAPEHGGWTVVTPDEPEPLLRNLLATKQPEKLKR